jgi:phosphocarrier protein
MKSFSYTIKDETGIHVRPAGLLVTMAQSFISKITVKRDEKSVDGKKLFALMGLNIKFGQEIVVTAEGEDEAAAAAALEEFLSKNL